jgi:2-keto-3-deoxy-L-rhamnonate aldolase RhmA
MTRRRLISTAALSSAAAQPQDANWQNPVRVSLKSGKPVVAATITVPSADVAAQAARLGFDLLWIEMEHSAITLESARNMILATRGLPGVPFIRVPYNEMWLAKRALDIGALGVIFPFTTTPEKAKAAVEACKYPPYGKRGSGPGLATLRWPAPEGYADFIDRNVMVVCIIEEKEAVDRIDEIAAVPGVDVLFIGTNDLSHSYGFRGRQDEPVVQGAIRKIVAAARKHNIPVGRPGNASNIPGFIKEGFSFFQAGSELALYADGAKPVLDVLGKQAAGSKDRPLY